MSKDAVKALTERQGYLQALLDVQNMIGERMEVLDNEHRALSANWFGGPRSRHREIMQRVRELKAFGDDILVKSRAVAKQALTE